LIGKFSQPFYDRLQNKISYNHFQDQTNILTAILKSFSLPVNRRIILKKITVANKFLHQILDPLHLIVGFRKPHAL
jgi:hypothetical protein